MVLACMLGTGMVSSRDFVYEVNQISLTKDALPAIRKTAAYFLENDLPGKQLLVIGHYSSVENKEIAFKRAVEVANVLLACSVPRDLIKLIMQEHPDAQVVKLSLSSDFFFTTY